MMLTKHKEGILRALLKLDKLANQLGIVLPKQNPPESKRIVQQPRRK